MWTLDFETEPIGPRPAQYPPKPVGVSIKHNDEEAHYCAWGHPEGNTWEYEDVAALLDTIWNSGEVIIFQNCAFDIAVAMKEFGLPWPKKYEDTLVLLYLDDPHAYALDLKTAAEKHLGMPPEERDLLKEWILRYIPTAKPSDFGAYISKAPVELVAPYANGDVERTHGLFLKLSNTQPVEAYHRELVLMPTLEEASQYGILCDRDRLYTDTMYYEIIHRKIETELRARLGDPNLDFSKDAQLAAALERAGKIDQWFLTPKGKRSVKRTNLEKGCNDPELFQMLAYHGSLDTCLSTFMHGWLELSQYDGRLHPDWNQIRGGDKGGGTRTGRLSCARPNFQNVPNEFRHAPPAGYPDLPLMRSYIVPSPGHVLIGRDFAQQELRVLAHYEDGAMLASYVEAPNTDFHEMAMEMIKQIAGIDLPRKLVKIIAFSILYGSGIRHLSEGLGCSPAEASLLKEAYYVAIPGIRDVQGFLKDRARAGQPIKTWGGRLYYCEPPRIIDGRKQSYEYKLLNYLIQGSSADLTKQSIIDWAKMNPQARFLATVHDEILLECPEHCVETEMDVLRQAMNADRLDVPMLSDGYIGDNWAEVKPYED